MNGFVKGVKEFEARWIGWAGVNVPDEVGQKALAKALAEKVLTFDPLTLRIFISFDLLDFFVFLGA